MSHGANSLVLVVDDDPDIRETVAAILDDEGYSTVTAANGREALAQLQRPGARRPDLILLDMMMPVLDGSGFRSEQRKQPELAAIPVVVFSAYGSVQQTSQAIEAAAYLSKPLRLEVLLEVVAGCLVKNGAR